MIYSGYTGTVSGTTYKNLYLRPSGGSYGTEDGSSYDNAFDGVAGINWSIVTPNTILWVCGTHTETLSMGASGTSSVHIRVRGDHPTDPGILDGLDILGSCFATGGQDYTECHGLKIRNASPNPYTSNGSTYHWLYDCEVTGSGDQCVETNSGVTLVIDGCLLDDANDDGISMHSGAKVTVRNTTISNCRGQGIQSSGGTWLVVEDCEFVDNATDVTTDCPATISRSTFVGPTVSVSVPGPVDYCLFDLRELAASTSFLGAAYQTVFSNCTTIAAAKGIIVSAVTLKNCIFYNLANIRYYAASAYSCSFYGLVNLKELAVNQNEVVGDPLFTNMAGNDFTLQAGSPCRDVGITGLGFVQDIDGNLIPSSSVDIGCHQNN